MPGIGAALVPSGCPAPGRGSGMGPGWEAAPWGAPTFWGIPAPESNHSCGALVYTTVS